MKKKHLELLHYLLDHNQAVTSNDLANVLGISSRSVKNYVLEINLLSKGKVIGSSKNGYDIHVQAARELLSQEEQQLPQTWEERSSYIIKQLMLERAYTLNLYMLCEQLYVGYSTLKSDIARMNKAYVNFEVQFVCEHDCICMLGEEKKKRSLISTIIREETNHQFLDINVLKESFHTIEINKVSAIIHTTFQRYHYYINDFANINLLLHLAIILERIREGNFIEKDTNEFTIESESEQALVTDLCTQLSEAFAITFTKHEELEIYMLFKTNANYTLPSNEETLRQLVGEDILNFSKEVTKKINEQFYIDLQHESFLTPFSLHLKNLILRAKQNSFTKNPMVDMIKHSVPTVYDIAIFIALQLMQRHHIQIVEDEVAFLALHIGAEIERQKLNDSKLQCVLLCPDYMEIGTQVYNYMLLNFNNHINISNMITHEGELEDIYYDMILTTVKLKHHYQKEALQISPFTQYINHAEVFSAIERVKSNKKNSILKKKFHQFFEQDCFFANPEQVQRDDVLHMVCENLERIEYVRSDFEEKVLLRERAASTAFVNIAVPHSMEMDALKTCVSVVICKKGITWGNNLVHVVMLMAINKADQQTFHELYEALIMLFSEDRMIESAKECATFKDFEKLIYSSINYKDDD